jgi:hypothetical protein
MQASSSSRGAPLAPLRLVAPRPLLHCRAMSSSSSNEASKQHSLSLRTGYLWHELYFWHCAGPWGNFQEYVQPMDHSPEHVETKRRWVALGLRCCMI